ncbi:Csu type fimbrial protein [Lysobacter auxotrophicus]|uniref:Spore coat U domain-containing protein n=1 Tax=Lysobacter auxotrophicus TaxID=2992573 RepID=A0ABM8DCD3_9GAMM|nr:spore coat U domain-containing protein [Lysobacter auxotrophicus]BDU16234.1 spore coat U domain-containing protein [Lysobacter auxotrophicus]
MKREDRLGLHAPPRTARVRASLIAMRLAMALAGACLALGKPTHAATRTANFNVTAQLVSDCSIVSAPNLDFGTVGVQNVAYYGTATLVVLCTPGTAYTVALDAGSVAGSTVNVRNLSGPGGNMTYSLYRDSGYTQIWGTTAGTDTTGGTGTGSNQSYTVYGRIFAMQTTKAPGTYTSTITATITY